MSFSEQLKKNQMKFAENALLQTIFEDPNQTIGDIWTSLEDDDEGEILYELFKKMTIGQLVIAGARFAEAENATKQQPPNKKPESEEEEDEDEFDDEEEVEYEEDDEEEDDDDDDSEEDDEDEDDEEEGDEEEEDENGEENEEDEEEEKPKKRKSKKKKKPAKSSKKKGKKDSEAIDLSTPEAQKTYQGTIVKCLKQNKARSEEKGMSAQALRKDVGGNPKQLRDNLNLLIGEGRIAYGGKARGMKYWLD